MVVFGLRGTVVDVYRDKLFRSQTNTDTDHTDVALICHENHDACCLNTTKNSKPSINDKYAKLKAPPRFGKI